MGLLSKIAKSLDARELKKYFNRASQVLELDDVYAKLTDDELKNKTIEFKDRLKKGETLDDILIEAFAAVREAAHRTVGMKHFQVQIVGGIILHEGNISEMKTGEGKTLVATLPAYLNALSGKGVHIVTVNDYLARRDSEWMGEIHRFLGLEVGLVVHGMNQTEKRVAYNADITYGTNNEYGFDYLRDNMVLHENDMVQRDLSYAIIDEVDSILVDEARTPLIISGSGKESTQLYTQANSFASRLREEADYTIDEKQKAITLTEDGVTKAERNFGVETLTDLSNIELQHHINQALKARYLMKKDVDYVVDDGEIVIVDEFTGRLMPGRRFNEGLHQAIEAKENVKVAKESVTLASITFQNYFRMYDKLSGMTGTAKTEEAEFKGIYDMDVFCIPTNKPLLRNDINDAVFATEQGKFKAVIEEIIARHEKEQPVLVGTISIEKSELLSKMLKKRGIKHTILNAKNHAQEAEIVAQAGQRGAITISTNMAGRGTDIVLGEGVVELGGLHIIGTERHESRRIDNQLRGRAGRQGDPGSSQFYISLEDDLMRMFGSERTQSLTSKVGLDDSEPLQAGILSKGIENAQKTVEGRNFGIRKHVLKYDDVMNKQREVIYAQRQSVLKGSDISNTIDVMINDTCVKNVALYTYASNDPQNWELDKLSKFLLENYRFKTDFSTATSVEELEEIVLNSAKEKRAELEKQLGPEKIRELERVILLRVVDSKWMEHIDNMDQLKQGINIRAYGHTDPVQAYTKEGFDMFEEMNESIVDDTVKYIFNTRVQSEETKAPQKVIPMYSAGKDGDSKTKKILTNVTSNDGISKVAVGKNTKCPCGSGKKYKQCCGKDLYK